MKREDEKERRVQKQAKVDGPDHCIHCYEDLCVFIQIELWLCETDNTYICTKRSSFEKGLSAASHTL
jgi:hypothetical protein